jgi:hypothetical protein
MAVLLSVLALGATVWMALLVEHQNDPLAANERLSNRPAAPETLPKVAQTTLKNR